MTRIKHEAIFEKELGQVAPIFGCAYFKIPDTKMINKFNRHRNREDKRPFDSILITPKGNYCIECKVNYNKLSEHQQKNQLTVNNINSSFYVLRKNVNTKQIIYSIIFNGKVVKKTASISVLVNYFLKKGWRDET